MIVIPISDLTQHTALTLHLVTNLVYAHGEEEAPRVNFIACEGFARKNRTMAAACAACCQFILAPS